MGDIPTRRDLKFLVRHGKPSGKAYGKCNGNCKFVVKRAKLAKKWKPGVRFYCFGTEE